ncbi:MAG: acyltransferase family protein [Methanobacteriaceae archaeon]|nr:acyltransferase family protein [Methanobacteriaceae archaeon]MDZ4172330.1 acyltransferase family protein [Methanobacteriaceae archaeon]
MRKYFLDNLRWMIILLLFPYHTFLIYNNIGIEYIIMSTGNTFATVFILLFSNWFMQLLFAIAGISTFYALKKRNSSEYLKERVTKLLIPTIAGIIFVLPVWVYYGFLYNGYTGNFLTFWRNFISNWFAFLADPYGSGLGPLWFLVSLFIISLLALPIIMKYRNGTWRIPLEKITIPHLLLLIIPLSIGSYFLNFAPQKSLVQFLLLFLFGYFFLSDDGIQQKLEDRRWPLFITFIGLTAIIILSYLYSLTQEISPGASVNDPLSVILINTLVWVAIMGIMGMGKRYLEFKNSATFYLAAASFPIYIFHIAWINIAAYYIIGFIPGMIALQMVLIMAISFVMTIATYEFVRRIKIIRFLFGIKG